ncbi:MAG: hypothetical protein AAF937_10355 [Planctomycetota bacterium]
MPTPASDLEFALRADRRAVLLIDGTPYERRTVLDNQISRFVLPVPAVALDADEVVIHIPEEREDSLQVLVSPFEIDGNTEAAADRWRIYHGDEPDTHWVAAEPIGVRLGPMVAGGDEIDLTNRLAGDEPRLCKRFNADPSGVGKLAHSFDVRAHGVCTLVGVDQLGLDIRSRWDIIRVPFGEAITDPNEAEGRIADLLETHDGDAA